MKNIKAVIFDLDGTLLNTVEDIMDSCNAALSAFNCPAHGLEDYNHFIGDGIEELVRRALPESRRDDELVGKCLDLVIREYGQRWHDKTVPYAGAREMLLKLRSIGLKMAVFSNKPHDFTEVTTLHYFPDIFFEVVLGALAGNPKKPDPWGAFHIAQRLGVDTFDCAYLGDTATDMMTARSASMTAIGAEWGFRGKDELVKAGADFTLKEPMALLELLIK